ncbi:MAG: hypothetical protein ACQEQE_04360 [Bacillota bacterium]
MKSKDYKKLFKLEKKANRYQKQGLYDKELEVYEEIHEKFYPNKSNLYKRPAVMYEKRGEFKKALTLCQQAIELIEKNKISGLKKDFVRMEKILKKKINSKKEKSIKSKNKKIMTIPKISLGFFVIIVIVIIILFYAFNKENRYESIELDLSELQQSTPLEGEIFNENENQEYPITEKMKQKANTYIINEPAVVDSVILSNQNSLGFGLLVKEGTSYSEAKDLTESFIKELAKIAASEYSLKASNYLYLGEIYDYYTIYVSVGTSNKKEDIILKAFKIKKGNKINYK